MKQALSTLCITLALAAPSHGAQPEQTDQTARVELASYAALYTVGLGYWLSRELDLNPRPSAWLAAGLVTGGIFGSLAAADAQGLTLGESRLVSSTSVWMMVDTVLAFEAVDEAADAKAVSAPVIWWMFAAGAAGGTAAFLAGPDLELSTGRVSLINSGGIWMPVGGLLLGVSAHLGDGSHLARDVLLLNLVGLTGGALLSRSYQPTESQVQYLDGGLLLGGLSGALVGGLVALGSDSWEVLPALALLGMAVGGWIAIDQNGFDGERGLSDAKIGRRAGAVSTTIRPVFVGSF